MKKELAEIQQEFSMEPLIDALLQSLDTPHAYSELIDNFLDKRLDQTSPHINIQLNRPQRRLLMECRGTSGMNIEEMQNYMRWAQRTTRKEGEIGFFNAGGKAAILWLSDKESSHLTFYSHPANDKYTYKLDITDWWKKLTPGTIFNVEKNLSSQSETKGITRIILDGADKASFAEIASLAEDLGKIYGPLLAKNKLNISLTSVSRGKARQFDVLPVLPLLDENAKKTSLAPLEFKGQNLNISVTYGRLSQKLKEEDMTVRQLYYGSETKFLGGNMIYVYHHDRLIEEIPIRELKIGRSDRLSTYSYAVIVQLKGPVDRTLFKDSLSRKSVQRQKILEKIKGVVEPDIQAMGDEESKMPERFARKANEISTILKITLDEVMKNPNSPITQTINELSELLGEETSPASAKSSKTSEVTLLWDKTRKNLPLGGEVQYKAEKTTLLPSVKATYLGVASPPAILETLDDNSLVIVLNASNAMVEFNLNSKGGLSYLALLEKAAEVIAIESLSSKKIDRGQDWYTQLHKLTNPILETALRLKIIK
jgi:hypothetical protein